MISCNWDRLLLLLHELALLWLLLHRNNVYLIRGVLISLGILLCEAYSSIHLSMGTEVGQNLKMCGLILAPRVYLRLCSLQVT
jgi:hypothetical protein